MTVALSALKAGDVVYDAHKVRAGNTMMRRMGVWRVRIVEVDADGGRVLASWNGNPPRWYYARRGKFSWRRTNPGERA